MSSIVDKLQKLESGVTVLIDASDNIIMSLPSDAYFKKYHEGAANAGLTIYADGTSVVVLDASTITRTQVYPDPEVTGLTFTQQTLATELATFFFSVDAGGGALTGDTDTEKRWSISGESSAAVVSTPTATVTFANIETVGILRIQPTLNCIVQGINSTGVTKQQVWWLINDSNFTITMPEENANPAPENRFIMSGTSQTLPAGGSLPLMYDLSINRFRLLTKS
jgi:hypothetical protein